MHQPEMIPFYRILSGALAKGKTELELSSTELREGDELIITCKITDKGKFDIGRIYRRIDGVKNGPIESEISSNNGVATALKDRYEIADFTTDEETDVTTIQVKIPSKYNYTGLFAINPKLRILDMLNKVSVSIL